MGERTWRGPGRWDERSAVGGASSGCARLPATRRWPAAARLASSRGCGGRRVRARAGGRHRELARRGRDAELARRRGRAGAGWRRRRREGPARGGRSWPVERPGEVPGVERIEPPGAGRSSARRSASSQRWWPRRRRGQASSRRSAAMAGAVGMRAAPRRGSRVEGAWRDRRDVVPWHVGSVMSSGSRATQLFRLGRRTGGDRSGLRVSRGPGRGRVHHRTSYHEIRQAATALPGAVAQARPPGQPRPDGTVRVTRHASRPPRWRSGRADRAARHRRPALAVRGASS